jgi:bifunctional UDP-N-acetylglucosamine pyrophosphorylase / glucosamine-1-phosphate N-acetyltransferase
MSTAAVILAAGMGKRMGSSLPKVLHEVLGKTMLERSGETALEAGADLIVAVLGHGRELAVPVARSRGWSYAVQEPQLGTAHAVGCAIDQVRGYDDTLILLGDVPLLKSTTLTWLQESMHSSGAPMAVLTTTPPNVRGYGRVIGGRDGRIERIVEEKDATEAERNVQVVNTGIMAFRTEFLEEVLPRLGNSNAQGEYYLTDAVEMAARIEEGAISVFTPDWQEVAGVNDPLQLAECTAALKRRIAERHLMGGVIIPDPSTVWIEDSVVVAAGAVIGRNCRLSGETVIGSGAVVGDGSVIAGCVIEPGEVIPEYSIIKAEE